VLAAAAVLPLAAGCVKEKPATASAPATHGMAKKETRTDAGSHLDSCAKKILMAGGQSGLVPLEDIGLKDGDVCLKSLFAKYPDAFVKIAEAAGRETMWAFYVVEEWDVMCKFARSPDSVVGPLFGIAKADRDESDRECAYKELRTLGPMFARDPDAFFHIARAAGKETCMAFILLETPGSRAQFNDYCEKKISLEELVRYVVR